MINLIYPNEIQTDRHWFTAVIDGIKQGELKAETREEVIEKCERFGIMDFIIGDYWWSEYL